MQTMYYMVLRFCVLVIQEEAGLPENSWLRGYFCQIGLYRGQSLVVGLNGNNGHPANEFDIIFLEGVIVQNN
ncbi:hypothetical protein YC2023_045911 [Brassica napus]